MSPYFFTVYVDNVTVQLHLVMAFMLANYSLEVLCNADDIALLSASCYGLQ